ncbi:MAG: hypothetical protein RBS80_32170 [Thermoguttaceae bacterium]|jgi:hypothetical protein|nr:hypothetical protein [Thermoguttaceae bacterium]
MLEELNRERLADELHELRLTLAAAGEQDGEFTREGIALGLKRIAGLLPEDCELLADRSAVDRVRRITHFCEELAGTIEGEVSVDVPLPDLARRCWQLSRGLRGRPAADQDPEVAAGDDAPNDAPASRWMPFVEMQNAFGFRTRKAFGVWVEANKIPCRPRPKKDGTPSKRRRDVDVLAILRAFRSDIAIAKDPVRQARVQRWLSKLEVDKDLEQAASEFLNAK